MKVIILAGGGGTRLFPLSRKVYPKQFLKIGSDKTLLAQTFERYLGLVNSSDIIVVTNKEYYYHVIAEMKECGIEDAHVLLEPIARNTAPAIALAVRYCLDNIGVESDEVLFVSPSDHIISPNDLFIKDIKELAKAAQKGKIATLGIKPDKPETGYGYIKLGKAWEVGHVAEEFVEKPDLQKAKEYFEKGNYYWNSGMFAFSIDTFKNELSAYQTEIYNMFKNNTYKQLINKFKEMPNISIDYAIAEKSKKVITVSSSSNWSDIGSWDAIYDVMEKDENKNVQTGDCKLINCSNSMIIGNERMVTGIGLEDTIVVETDDVILVAKKGESQKVKELVNQLREANRKQVDEHTTGYRPWGNYKVLSEGEGYKVKKILVYPGQKLSMQMHYYRSEHWVVINGTAKVTIDDEEKFVSENESIFIPKATKHRLENPGNMLLEIVEVQDGKYLEEDDIIRFDDIYGRE